MTRVDLVGDQAVARSETQQGDKSPAHGAFAHEANPRASTSPATSRGGGATARDSGG